MKGRWDRGGASPQAPVRRVMPVVSLQCTAVWLRESLLSQARSADPGLLRRTLSEFCGVL